MAGSLCHPSSMDSNFRDTARENEGRKGATGKNENLWNTSGCNREARGRAGGGCQDYDQGGKAEVVPGANSSATAQGTVNIIATYWYCCW